MKPSAPFSRAVLANGVKSRRALEARAWKYPAALERRYARSLARYLRGQADIYADRALALYVPRRRDAVDDILPEDPTRAPTLGAIVSLAEDIDGFNRREMEAFQALAVGTSLDIDEPWVPDVLDTWAKEQLTLITRASGDMQKAIGIRVRDGVSNGWTADRVRSNIRRDLPGMCDRRAAVIARDQVAKLNSSLSRGRMEQAGFETYIWSTSMDERVRGNPGGLYPGAVPSHWVMEGRVCRWDNPGVWQDRDGSWVSRPLDAPTVHPGEAIMCRCVAVPNWREVDDLAELTEEERAESELQAAAEAVARAATGEAYAAPGSKAAAIMEAARKVAEQALAEIKARATTAVQEAAVAASVALQFIDDPRKFREYVQGEFPGTSGFKPAYFNASQARLANLPTYVKARYEAAIDDLADVKSDGGKAYFSPSRNFISVAGKKAAKGAPSYGSDFVHEAGHAMDRGIGRKLGTGYASMARRPDFDSLTLAELVDADLVRPVMAKVAAEREAFIGSMADEMMAMGPALRKLGTGLLSDMWEALHVARGAGAPAMPEAVRMVLFYGRAHLGPEAVAAVAAGDREGVVAAVKAAARTPAVDKTLAHYSPTMAALRDELKAVGDEEVVFGGFSDMFEAATGKRDLLGRWGHGVAYWSDPENPCTEAWAEILEMLASPEPGARRVLDKYLARPRDYVLKSIEEVAE